MQLPDFLIPELDDETLRHMTAAIVKCMNFKSGESTLITGGLHTWKLIEMIRIECAGKSVSSIVDATSDEFNRALAGDVPIDFLRKPGREMISIANTVDAYIKIVKDWDPNSNSGLPKESIVSQRESQREVEGILEKRGVRKTLVGYPTTPTAASLGVSFDELKQLIVGGMLYDQKQLLTKCDALAKFLIGADRVHLQDAYGTDLIVHITGRRISKSDGLISEEDQKIGYNTANLPTGEVFIAAHEEIGEGTLFCPLTRDRLSSKPIRNTRLIFEKGKLAVGKCRAEEGEEELKNSLKLALESDGRKFSKVRTLNIAELGLGLNDKINKPIGYILTDEKIGGSAHVAIGDNKSYGGTSESSLHWDFVTCPKETVTVIQNDGSEKRIVEDGQIIIS